MEIEIDLAALRARIEANSIPIPFSRCRLWLGAMGKRRGTSGHSYGAIRLGRTMTTASRASYLAFVGPIPRGKHVLHRCDHTWCVEPDCLFLGNAKTNMIDKQVKGRAGRKLTAAIATEIRRLASLATDLPAIAAQFGVTVEMIRQVVKRTYWGHVP